MMPKVSALIIVSVLLLSSFAYAGILGGDNWYIIKKGSDSNVFFNCPTGQAIKSIDHNVYTCIAVGGGGWFSSRRKWANSI